MPVQAGDPSGDPFARLLDDQGPRLLLYARTWVDSVQAAEELVHDAVVNCWKQDPRLERTRPAYLYVSIRHLAMSRHREATRRRIGPVADDLVETEFACPFASGEQRAEIAKAMARLPEAQREAILLHVWGGLTFAEIGEVVGCPLATAASRYRLALDSLRSLLSHEVVQP